MQYTTVQLASHPGHTEAAYSLTSLQGVACKTKRLPCTPNHSLVPSLGRGPGNEAIQTIALKCVYLMVRSLMKERRKELQVKDYSGLNMSLYTETTASFPSFHTIWLREEPENVPLT